MTRSTSRLRAAGVAALVAISVCAPALSAGASPPAAVGAPRPIPRTATREARGVIVRYRDGISRSARIASMSEAEVAATSAVDLGHGLVTARPRPGETPRDTAARLAKDPRVRWAVPDLPMRALGMSIPPNDTYYTDSGSYLGSQRLYMGPRGVDAPNSIDVEPAWDRAFNGTTFSIDPYREGVKIAVVDTGYQSTSVESPAGRIVPMWNFIAHTTDTTDDYGHGTKVAMMIRAQTDNSFGIAGALGAGTSKLLIYKVLDSQGSGTSSDAMAAIERAADDGAKVISCSIGESQNDLNGDPVPGLQAAWDEVSAYAASKGSVIVAASGNGDPERGIYYGIDDVNFPAAAAGAVAVGSISSVTGSLSGFSNFGPQLSLVAPGQAALQFSKDPGTVTVGSGTSFSTPLVSGSLALLWSAIPSANASAVVSAATSTANDYGDPGRDDEYGYGEIDVWRAYQALMTSFPSLAPISVSASPVESYATTVTWSSPPTGTGLSYVVGYEGGPSFYTSSNSGRLVFSHDGTFTVQVTAYAADAWPSTAATCQVAFHAGPPPSLVSDRIAGPDRYATAARASYSSFPPPSQVGTVVVVSGENWPDALAASPLAKLSGAPLLLTHRYSVPTETAAEIARLRPAAIVIVGGTAAVSSGVSSALSADAPVSRIAGSDRYSTAGAVALLVADMQGGRVPLGTAVVASGENYPDALAAAPMAAAAGWPILLTHRDSLPAATTDALSSIGATSTLLLGGTQAVSSAVEDQLPSTSRVAGATRYDTALAVADYAISHGVLGVEHLGVSTGRNFPDALAGGVTMAHDSGPMLLVDGYTPELGSWLAARGPAVSSLRLFGGENVLPASTATMVSAELRP